MTDKEELEKKMEKLKEFNRSHSEILDRMVTFVKRGKINSPRNWYVKSRLNSAFADLFRNIEEIGYLKANQVISPFMNHPEYMDMLHEVADNFSGYSGNKEKYRKIFNDIKYQDEHNISESFKADLKEILLDGYVKLRKNQSAILNESYQLAEEKFKRSVSKKKVAPNKFEYRLLNAEFHKFDRYLDMFGSDLILKLREKDVLKDLLHGSSPFYMLDGSDGNNMFRGNLAQALYSQVLLTQSRVLPFSNFAKKLLICDDIFKKEKECINEALKAPVRFGMLRYKESFRYRTLMDESVLDEQIKKEAYLFEDRDFSLILNSFEGMFVRFKGKSPAENDRDFNQLGSVNASLFWETLVKIPVTTPKIEEYKVFLAYRSTCDEYFYKSTIAWNMNGSQKIKPADLEQTVKNMNSFMMDFGLTEKDVEKFNGYLFKMGVVDKLESKVCYNEEKEEQLKEVIPEIKERVSKNTIPTFLLRDKMHKMISDMEMPGSDESAYKLGDSYKM